MISFIFFSTIFLTILVAQSWLETYKGAFAKSCQHMYEQLPELTFVEAPNIPGYGYYDRELRGFYSHNKSIHPNFTIDLSNYSCKIHTFTSYEMIWGNR